MNLGRAGKPAVLPACTIAECLAWFQRSGFVPLRFLICVVLAFFIQPCLASSIQASLDDILRKSDAYFRMEDRERNLALQELFREFSVSFGLDQARFDELDDASLRAIIQVVNATNLLCGQKEPARIAQEASLALHRRGQLPPALSDSAMDQLFCTGQYRRLRAFAKAIDRTLPPLPIGSNRINSSLNVIRFDVGGAPTFETQFIGDRIIVISHPGCGFSRALAEAASRDSELTALLEDALWLTPVPKLALYNALLRDSTVSAQEVHYRSATALEAWPQVANWSTPQVLFFKDGVLFEAISGWPKEGRKIELLSAREHYCKSFSNLQQAPAFCE